MRQVDRLHVLRVDARPHDVGVPATVLFVNDDRAGLLLEADRFFGAVGGIHQHLDGREAVRWRVQAEGEQKLAAPRASRHGARFIQRAAKIGGHKATQFVDFDMVVVDQLRKMRRQIAGTASLRRFQDHF